MMSCGSLTWPMIAPLMIFRYSPICIDWSSISSLNRTGETVKSGADKPVIRTNAKTKQAAKTTVPGIRKIVLDPGHGGKDPGAIGVGGVAEKDLVLSIAKKLAVKLTRELGIEVILTRKDDRYVRWKTALPPPTPRMPICSSRFI